MAVLHMLGAAARILESKRVEALPEAHTSAAAWAIQELKMGVATAVEL